MMSVALNAFALALHGLGAGVALPRQWMMRTIWATLPLELSATFLLPTGLTVRDRESRVMSIIDRILIGRHTIFTLVSRN